MPGPPLPPEPPPGEAARQGAPAPTLTLTGAPRQNSGGVYTPPPSSETHLAPPFPALTTEGIFRRSANTQVVREVQQKYNMGEWSGDAPRPSGWSRSHKWGLGVEGGGGWLGGMCVTVMGPRGSLLPCKQGPQILFLSEVVWHLV